MINELKSHIKKFGISRANRYTVIFSLPDILLRELPELSVNESSAISVIGGFLGASGSPTRSLSIMCENVSYPSVNIKKGEFWYTLPHGKTYEDVVFTFRLSESLFEKRVFEKWVNLIENNLTRKHAFFDEITSDITIQKLDINGKVRHEQKLIKAFPTVLNSMELNDSTNDLLRMSLSMNFFRISHDWEEEDSIDTPTGTLESLLSGDISPDNLVLNAAKFIEAVQTGNFSEYGLEAYSQLTNFLDANAGMSTQDLERIVQNFRDGFVLNPNLTNADKAELSKILDSLGG